MNYEKLLQLMNEQGLSRRKLAISAGIPPTTLNSAINNHSKHFPQEYIVKLAHVLGVHWSDLLDMNSNAEWISLVANGDERKMVYEVDNGVYERVYKDLYEQSQKEIIRLENDNKRLQQASDFWEDKFNQLRAKVRAFVEENA